MADIDDFTEYNGGFGDEKGDICLKSVAGALRSVARRPTDLLGRYAGGKFALLLPESDAQAANIIARRAIDAVDSLRIPYSSSKAQSHCITVSVGGGYRNASRTTFKPLANVVPNDLIAAAERGVALAKSCGGHQAQFVDVAQIGSPQTALSGTKS